MPTTHPANSIGSQLQVAANSPRQTCKDDVFWHPERRTSTEETGDARPPYIITPRTAVKTRQQRTTPTSYGVN
eukprot:2631802-Alexandrium_andersonii.AAC.1